MSSSLQHLPLLLHTYRVICQRNLYILTNILSSTVLSMHIATHCLDVFDQYAIPTVTYCHKEHFAACWKWNLWKHLELSTSFYRSIFQQHPQTQSKTYGMPSVRYQVCSINFSDNRCIRIYELVRDGTNITVCNKKLLHSHSMGTVNNWFEHSIDMSSQWNRCHHHICLRERRRTLFHTQLVHLLW